ncbi:unnamed protein product [Acanthocheilonema viteae]|uniref:Dipeptidylpeptidase IV N-terminal domain-containing protein n=1 Tax=Acanthocheilonema viteae TaxID=6277 RepID=A0A498S7J3_ACAVI|nr:unnamed protein product [Acanthocheilonema viteae]
MHIFNIIPFFLLTGATTFAKLHFPAEHHLSNIRQLTFGGQNAEGYFSFDGKWLTFQATGIPEYGTSCDQIYKLDLTVPPEKQFPQRISTGIGACTCSYFYPDNRHMIYAGTFQHANFTSSMNIESCPMKTCQTQRAKTDPRLRHLCNTSYTWDLFPEYDIFKVNEFGTVIQRLTDTVGYDAEGAVSPDGQKIVFTSLRSGDPEIWIMNSDGTEPKQLTNELGYDGGPFFSPDGSKIVFRASRPNTSDEIQTYKDLLSYNLVSPLQMELYTINIDGSGLRKVTSLGGSNWAPFYMPDNHHIIFSSNFNETGGHFGAFNLYMINEEGGNVERITFNEGGFDAFPMFDRTGRRLVWGSSRNGRSRSELNLFIADWHDTYTMKIGNDIKEENLTLPNFWEMEKNFPKKIEQLTKDDINMAGSFSFDDKRVIYEGYGTHLYDTVCEQVFDLSLISATRRIRRLSTGIGATRSPIYVSDGDIILYASNVLTANRSTLNSCPRRACSDTRQSWIKEICKLSHILDLYPDFELIKVNKYGNFIQRLTNTPGYDGDASISSDERHIIFTSRRAGDPDLWTIDMNGKNAKQMTKTTGYEGGAAFSPDGRFIVFHASRPRSPIQLVKYYWYNAVELADTQIFLMHSDGSGLRQLTRNGTNLWPTFLSNKRILFSSNGILADGTFNIFAVNIDGSQLEQITTDRDYDNFHPAISHDGMKLLWSRNTTDDGQMNLYLALIGKKFETQ